MKRKLSIIAAPIALITGLAFSVPAAAQGVYSPGQMRAEIAQLDRQIARIGQSRAFTNSEYRRMTNAVDALDRLYDRYRRGGFSSYELRSLSNRIDNLHVRVAQQANDRERLRRC